MHKNARRLMLWSAIGAGVVGVVALGLTFLPRGQPAGESLDATPVKEPVGEPTPMAFTKAGLAGDVLKALEHVVRPGRAQVAVTRRRAARWVCVVVDGDQRYYELDRGMREQDFAALREAGFRPLPPDLTRVTSIYRSVARSAVPSYDDLRGDATLVLLCPRDQWSQLALLWPGVPLRRK